MESESLVLAYFDIRGLAQPIRYLLVYFEVKFENKKYTSRDEWFG